MTIDEAIANARKKAKEIKQLRKRTKTGHWIDCSDEGFVVCSECGSATNCNGNINELHFCFYCGARMNKGGREE